MVVSCQPDLVEEDPVLEEQHKMSITHTSLSRLSKSAPEVYDRSLSLALSVSKFTKSSGDSTSLVLDTTNVYITEGLDYKNYIFRVEPDANSQPDELKNLMIVRLRDSLTHQYLVTYKMLDAQTIDTTNVRVEGFFAEDLSGHIPKKCGGTEMVMTWIEGHYVEYNCDLSGRHSPGEVCIDGKYHAGVYWVAGHFEVQFVEQEDCGSYPSTGGSSGGSQSGGGEQVDLREDRDGDASINVGAVLNPEPVEPEDPECKYLKDLLADTDFNSNFMNLVRSVTDDDHETVHEYTQNLDGTQRPFYRRFGSRNVPKVPVRRLPRDVMRKVMVHTHYYDIDDGTISMFSYTDLMTFLDDVQKVEALRVRDTLPGGNPTQKDTRKMTNIIIAHDGTEVHVYAIKKDPSKDIANHYRGHQIENGMTQDDMDKEVEDYKKEIKRAKDQETLEIVALGQLQKMGLHLYRAENNQSEWTRLTLNPNSDPDDAELGAPEPCN